MRGGCECNLVDVDVGNAWGNENRTGSVSGAVIVKDIDGSGLTLFKAWTRVEGPVAAEKCGKEGAVMGSFFMVETISGAGVCNTEELMG